MPSPAKPAAKIQKSAMAEGQALKKLKPSGKAEVSFFEQVYAIVAMIPKGRVTSYGAIARALGSGLSARMVGWAMNGAHQDLRQLPAQRVVNRNGQLSGKAHFATPTRMQELLEKEGIAIENDTIKDFKKHFWDPANELDF